MPNEILYEQGGDGHHDLPPGVYRIRHIPLNPKRREQETFYSTEQASTAYFSACGYLDDQKTGTITTGAYTSHISQADADAKALQAAQVSADAQLQHVLDTGFTLGAGGIDTFECYDGTAVMNSWGGWDNPWSGGDNLHGAVLAAVTDNVTLAGEFVLGSNQDVVYSDGQGMISGFSVGTLVDIIPEVVLVSVADSGTLASDFIYGSNQDVIHNDVQGIVSGFFVGTLFDVIINGPMGNPTDRMSLVSGFSHGTLLNASVFAYGTEGVSLVTGFAVGTLFDTLISTSGTEGMALVAGFTAGTLLDVALPESETENMGLGAGFQVGALT